MIYENTAYKLNIILNYITYNKVPMLHLPTILKNCLPNKVFCFIMFKTYF